MPVKKQIKMPTSIRLAGRFFSLGFAPKNAMVGTSMGQYIPMEGRIVIAGGMGGDQTKSTVLHEMIHDFNNQSSNDLTESQVNSVAALMFAAIRDNPELFAWFQDRD